ESRRGLVGGARASRRPCHRARRRPARRRRAPAAGHRRPGGPVRPPGLEPHMLTFTVNGTEVTLHDVPPGESLLTALRERCGLRGTKNACEQGECGSCLVALDGRTACS